MPPLDEISPRCPLNPRHPEAFRALPVRGPDLLRAAAAGGGREPSPDLPSSQVHVASVGLDQLDSMRAIGRMIGRRLPISSSSYNITRHEAPTFVHYPKMRWGIRPRQRDA
jgi:hypothetical protein